MSDAPSGTPDAFDRDYRALRDRIRSEGWDRPSLRWAVGRTASVIALLGLALFVDTPLLRGALFGLFVQQAAFLAHDACHGALGGRAARGLPAWLFATVCFGIDPEKWARQHNAHHRLVNRPLVDPQLNTMPHVTYAAREVAMYEASRRPLTRTERVLLRHQHLWLLPVLLVYGRINMIRGDLAPAFRRGDRRMALGYLGHTALWLVTLGPVAAAAPSTTAAVADVAICALAALAVSGFVHVQLILSHAYAPRLTREEQGALGMRVQILSNQNISCGPATRWFHGGLEHHIEHHLFPRVPRHNLSRLAPHVRALCADHGLEYRSAPLHVCLFELFAPLRRAARGVS